MFMAKEHFVGPREHKLDREFQICFAEKETTNLPTKKLQPFKAKNTGKGTMEDTDISTFYKDLKWALFSSVNGILMTVCKWNLFIINCCGSAIPTSH